MELIVLEYGSQEVQCPFYKDETKNAVRCEGIFGSSCVCNFKNTKEKKTHKRAFCNTNYDKCLLYEAIIKKY